MLFIKQRHNGVYSFNTYAKMAYLYLLLRHLVYNINMTVINLKKQRQILGISSKKASAISNVPLRTYQRYEQSVTYGNVLKRKAIFDAINKEYEISEDKGLLSIDIIKKKINKVLSRHKKDVHFCYLFGSYAKGYAKENSDIDLCISTTLTGLEFVGLTGELYEELNKKIDLLRLSDIQNNNDLLNEIMKDGIKIYG